MALLSLRNDSFLCGDAPDPGLDDHINAMSREDLERVQAMGLEFVRFNKALAKSFTLLSESTWEAVDQMCALTRPQYS